MTNESRIKELQRQQVKLIKIVDNIHVQVAEMYSQIEELYQDSLNTVDTEILEKSGYEVG